MRDIRPDLRERLSFIEKERARIEASVHDQLDDLDQQKLGVEALLRAGRTALCLCEWEWERSRPYHRRRKHSACAFHPQRLQEDQSPAGQSSRLQGDGG